MVELYCFNNKPLLDLLEMKPIRLNVYILIPKTLIKKHV